MLSGYRSQLLCQSNNRQKKGSWESCCLHVQFMFRIVLKKWNTEKVTGNDKLCSFYGWVWFTLFIWINSYVTKVFVIICWLHCLICVFLLIIIFFPYSSSCFLLQGKAIPVFLCMAYCNTSLPIIFHSQLCEIIKTTEITISHELCSWNFFCNIVFFIWNCLYTSLLCFHLANEWLFFTLCAFQICGVIFANKRALQEISCPGCKVQESTNNSNQCIL